LGDLKRLTIVIAIAGLLILLTGQSDDPTVLGRYSLRYLAVVAAYSVGMGVGIALLMRPAPRLPGWVWLTGSAAALAVIAWLPLLAERPLLNLTLRLAFGWLVIALVIHSRATLPRFRTAAIGMGAALLALSALTLQSFPALQTIDEGWNANVGWTFVQEGMLYARINQGIFGIPEVNVPTANVLPGYWMRAAGVGLFQVRALVWFGGLIALALTFAAALRLYRRRDVAVVAALAAAGSAVILFNSHLFRLDIWLGVAALLAFYLYLRAADRPAWALLAGFVLAAGIEIHQNALALCLGGGLFIVGATVIRSIRQRRLAIARRDVFFALGGFVGALLFLALHVLPDAAAFQRQLSASLGVRGASQADQPSAVFGPLGFLVDMLARMAQTSPFETAAFVVVTAAGLLRKPTRPLALLLLAILVAYGLVAPTLTIHYLVNFWALFALLFAGVCADWIAGRRVAVLVLCAAMALPSVVSMVQMERAGRNERVLALAADIADGLDRQERIVALHYFFFVLPDAPLLTAPFMPEYAAIVGADVQGIDVWRALAPDVFIVSTALAEPDDTLAADYRAEQGFVETARHDDAGCCIVVYQRP
jgi:hypothetical protein